jgi:hypothetical protein
MKRSVDILLRIGSKEKRAHLNNLGFFSPYLSLTGSAKRSVILILFLRIQVPMSFLKPSSPSTLSCFLRVSRMKLRNFPVDVKIKRGQLCE